jgi:acetylornithine deacetylase
VETASGASPIGPGDGEILEAIATESAWMEELLVRLVEAPTTLGDEEPGQVVMEEAFAELGLEPYDVTMDTEVLSSHPLASPFSWDVSSKRNVVATWQPVLSGGGKSLVLNGHIDVVSPEPLALWSSSPFRPRRDGEWLYGRGAGDMKAGLAAMLGAVRGLRQLGVRPAAPVELQSVVEEECTGNGALATALASPFPDAAVVTEPFGNGIMVAQVGVLWFHVRALGMPAHVGEAPAGVNAIEKIFSVAPALEALEAKLNDAPPPPFDKVEHPANLNLGVIRGGDWPSTVAGECVLSCRIAVYPGTEPDELLEEIREAVGDAVTVEKDGFACNGFAAPADDELVQALKMAHERRSGAVPELIVSTATTDARIYRFLGVPAACLGPYAERLHAADERVWLPSLTEAAQTLGLFIRDWCGLS